MASDQGLSDKHFVNPRPDNQHFIWEYSKTCVQRHSQKDQKMFMFSRLIIP